jgi:transcription-repair coupling factor (superfamily II helicase)
VDIVVGTHRLLQKDVSFKDLGLVIIDEEQRFGVTHKEGLKKLRTLVDVLTLSATPIPRTLHLSLVGLRDLSIINTPPETRQPIKTYALEFNEDIIRDAIRVELERQGQVFFLHDRVKSIYTMARFVERLVPEARVGVVHGQMKPRDTEEAMARFVQRETNVLVCTSIIGAGLDIPNANTIIVNRADRFGLSQLYQIRGRVGRFKDEAFAYLLVPGGPCFPPTPSGASRSSWIFPIRVPGSALPPTTWTSGAQESPGHFPVGAGLCGGYELYTELLEKTISELKGRGPGGRGQTRDQPGHLGLHPCRVHADEHQRLVTYKRVSMASADEDLAAVEAELTDCFGFVPPGVKHLLGVICIRNLMRTLKARKLGYDGKQFFLAFQADSPVDPARIVAMTRRKGAGVRLTPDHKLYVPVAGLSGAEIPEAAASLLRQITMP